jgi:hypothetical protein
MEQYNYKITFRPKRKPKVQLILKNGKGKLIPRIIYQEDAKGIYVIWGWRQK